MWRDISTAPKQYGVGLLGWNAAWGAPDIIEWVDETSGEKQGYWLSPIIRPDVGIKKTDQPTHWMPLPPPPEDTSLSGRTGSNAYTADDRQLRDTKSNPKQDRDALVGALSKRCFILSGPHLSGWTLTIGFERREDVDDAHKALASLTPPKLEARSQAETEVLSALKDVTASLVAAHSLLERGGKKAAPSDKMFAVMLSDYAKSIERARLTIQRAQEGRTPASNPPAPPKHQVVRSGVKFPGVPIANRVNDHD